MVLDTFVNVLVQMFSHIVMRYSFATCSTYSISIKWQSFVFAIGYRTIVAIVKQPQGGLQSKCVVSRQSKKNIREFIFK